MQPRSRPLRRQRGSVLVVCVGVLAILALMATAFVTAMNLQKTVGSNVKHGVHAEMAAQAGLSHAIAQIVANYGGSTGLDEDWFADFKGSDVTDLLKWVSDEPSTATIDPFPDSGDYNYTGAKWINGPNPNLVTGDYTASNSGDDKTRLRYAVLPLDLTGRLFAHAAPAGAARADAPDLFSGIVQCEAVTSDKFTRGKAVFNNNPVSWLHAQYLYSTNGGSTSTIFPSDTAEYWQNRITPFGDDSPANQGLAPVNLNTAPLAVLKAMAIYTNKNISGLASITGIAGADALQAGDGSGVGPLADGDTLFGNGNLPTGADYEADIAKALYDTAEHFRSNPSCASAAALADYFVNEALDADTHVLSIQGTDAPRAARMETAVNDIAASFLGRTTQYDLRGTGTPLGGADATPWVGRWYCGPSSYYYIIVRGQAVRSDNDAIILSERNLEAVVKVFPYGSGTRTKVLYRRWFSR